MEYAKKYISKFNRLDRVMLSCKARHRSRLLAASFRGRWKVLYTYFLYSPIALNMFTTRLVVCYLGCYNYTHEPDAVKVTSHFLMIYAVEPLLLALFYPEPK